MAGVLRWFGLGGGKRVPVSYEPTYMFSRDDVVDLLSGVGGLSPVEMYRRQDEVRTVLDFRARNVAQIGMHAYMRRDDGGRDRVRSGDLAAVVSQPAPGLSWFQLAWALTLDFDLHFRTYAMVGRYNGRRTLVHVPSRRVRLVSGSWGMGDFRAEIAPVVEGQKPVTVGADVLIPFHLWSPADGGEDRPLSPMESLQVTLAEQVAAQSYRLRRWKKSGQRVERPADAPPWTPEDRARFVESIRRFIASQGGGSAPLLEDGMKLVTDDLKAADEQFVEATKLSREKVAAAYGLSPADIGSSDGVTYGNMVEYRKRLYGEALGGTFKMFEQVLNGLLVPMLAPGEDVYLEFNLKERLRADPVEEAKVYQASVGAPYLTRNEARVRMNLPKVEGGDELITPLNVVTGAVANPQDTAPSDNPLELSGGAETKGVGEKAARRQTVTGADPGDVAEVRDVLVSFFSRQRKSLASAEGAGSAAYDWERWSEELFQDLQTVMPTISEKQTRRMLDDLGIDDLMFDAFRSGNIDTLTWSHAENLTVAVGQKLQEGASVADVFDDLDGYRTAQYADTIVTSSQHRRAVDIAAQYERGMQRKTGVKAWRVTSRNPRSSHAAMDGETVPVNKSFSNGAMFPRHSVLGPAGVANCQCRLEISMVTEGEI